MLNIVDAVGEEDGGEVDVGVAPAVKVVESVAGEVLDPFWTCTRIEFGIIHGQNQVAMSGQK